jgi:ribosome-binding factor A
MPVSAKNWQSNYFYNQDYKSMQEGKRQKQIGGLLQEELNTIFQRLGLSMINGGMISISSIKVTPDLLEARIYVSFFQVQDIKETLKKIEERSWEIKRELAASVKHQLRRIPQLKFFHDDTLDNAFKMEELFKQIKTTPAPVQPDKSEGEKDEQ